MMVDVSANIQDTTGVCEEKVVLEQRWGHTSPINSL